MKSPLDTSPYPKDPRSAPLASGLPDGLFVYVQVGKTAMGRGFRRLPAEPAGERRQDLPV
jgi:hypothetical protein